MLRKERETWFFPEGKSLLQQWLRWILGRGEYVFPCLLGASLERLRGLFFRRSKKVGVQMWGDDDIAAAKCELEVVLPLIVISFITDIS